MDKLNLQVVLIELIKIMAIIAIIASVLLVFSYQINDSLKKHNLNTVECHGVIA